MINNMNYFRIITCVPRVYPGQPMLNADIIIDTLKSLLGEGNTYDLIVFPELCISGYTCGDLFLTDNLHQQVQKGLDKISDFLYETKTQYGFPACPVIVGAPVTSESGGLWNTAIVLTPEKDSPRYVIPKYNLPEYSEFYEKRWFNPGNSEFSIPIEGYIPCPSGVVMISGVKVGIEICEDLWVALPECEKRVTISGAEVIVNLSASPDLAGKTSYLMDLIKVTSARLICGYAYVSAGPWESSTDLVFSGNQYSYENGVLLGTNDRPKNLQEDSAYLITDFDIQEIRGYRRRNKPVSFGTRADTFAIPVITDKPEKGKSLVKSEFRKYDPTPFLKKENYPDILRIQSLGLQKRIMACGGENCKCIIGVSGGTDSTWALIVAVNAYHSLGFPVKNIIGVTMPCFGTTERTKNNSWTLMNALGITGREIDITSSVTAHLQELGHPLDVYDIAYENAQARMRTQTLFNLTNMEGGIVIGTGDLSELALGWCTYGADHLSSYNVNVSVPKTLVKDLISWYCSTRDLSLRSVLSDILDTPISPELLPPTETGEIKQVSENTVGPYELHDYFLYHFLRSGMSAKKILYTCYWAFDGKYTLDEIWKWETVFFKRFASQQFKRSCLPDGPKVGSISLSPRGDWRMPSDVSLKEYLIE